MNLPVLVLLSTAALASLASAALKADECEVCISLLDRFSATLEKDEKSSPEKIEKRFREFCKDLKLKENRFCYYLGGTDDAATGILGEMSKPLSWGLPSDKVCEKLKKKDKQICELRYDKQIDLNNVDFKKLKVRDLKKILNDWDESCEGCIEKADFIKRIDELKSKHIRNEL